MGRLDTFVAPQPHFPLIKAMTLVNRVFMLKGVAGFRDLPPFNRLAGLRGLANVRCIDFPKNDQERLAAVIGPGKATFITPNHPEFFTDWMIDKEISSRLAPKAAFWATNGVVNGLGKLAQKFWLANNLIAQIPGNSEPARAHSVDWALKGNVVLLHPEGQVGWHRDVVAPLMTGAGEMALQALEFGQATGQQVWLAPVVWKLRFTADVEAELAKECAYVEDKLGMSPAAGAGLAERIFAIYDALLKRDELALGIVTTEAQSFASRHAQAVETLAALIAAEICGDPFAPVATILSAARKHLRETGTRGTDSQLKTQIDRLTKLVRIGPFAWSRPSVSQEELAEHIKRLRADHCFGSWRDTLNRFVPQPAGQRTAHIRAPEPIAVHERGGDAQGLMAELRRRMQKTLNDIDLDVSSLRSYPNPFYAGRAA